MAVRVNTYVDIYRAHIWKRNEFKFVSLLQNTVRSRVSCGQDYGVKTEISR